jgi:hypothetical protein
MRGTTLSIGDPDGSQAPASKTGFGWRKLEDYSGHAEAEDRVGKALIDDFSVYVTRAGDRTQSYDLEVTIPNGPGRRSSARRLPTGLISGLYEVKSLWRRNERSAFDRRFKVGTRGETIYGRRDSQIKAFALTLESEMEQVYLELRAKGDHLWSNTEFVEFSHQMIDHAMARRHSKWFNDQLGFLTDRLKDIPVIAREAKAVLSGGISTDDIFRGFSDIQGIFVVAGPIYTLVTKAEMGNFLSFDSASSEGPKIRMLGVIPSETTQRKEKGKTKK